MKWFGQIKQWFGREKQCKAKTRSGNRCPNTAKKGSKYCGISSHQDQGKDYRKYFSNLPKKWKIIPVSTLIALLTFYFSILKPKVHVKDRRPYSIAKEATFNINNGGNFTLRNTRAQMGLIYIRTNDNITYATYGDINKPLPYFADKWVNMRNILSGEDTTFFIPDNFKIIASGEWKEGAMCISIFYSYFLHGNEKKEVGFLLKDNKWEPRTCNELRKRYPPIKTSAERK